MEQVTFLTQTLDKAVREDGREDVLEAVSFFAWYFPTFVTNMNIYTVEFRTKVLDTKKMLGHLETHLKLS